MFVKLLETTLITYSNNGISIHGLIIKAETHNKKIIFDFIEFKWEDTYLSHKVCTFKHKIMYLNLKLSYLMTLCELTSKPVLLEMCSKKRKTIDS